MWLGWRSICKNMSEGKNIWNMWKSSRSWSLPSPIFKYMIITSSKSTALASSQWSLWDHTQYPGKFTLAKWFCISHSRQSRKFPFATKFPFVKTLLSKIYWLARKTFQIITYIYLSVFRKIYKYSNCDITLVGPFLPSTKALLWGVGEIEETIRISKLIWNHY